MCETGGCGGGDMRWSRAWVEEVEVKNEEAEDQQERDQGRAGGETTVAQGRAMQNLQS